MGERQSWSRSWSLVGVNQIGGTYEEAGRSHGLHLHGVQEPKKTKYLDDNEPGSHRTNKARSVIRSTSAALPCMHPFIPSKEFMTMCSSTAEECRTVQQESKTCTQAD